MKYEETVTCHFCYHKDADFKVIREWDHGLHLLNSLMSPDFRENFRYYFGERKNGMKFSYTIPKSMEVKQWLIKDLII